MNIRETRKMLERTLELTARRLDNLDKFGEVGALENESIIMFKKSFSRDYGRTERIYTYAGVKINDGLWYLTGSGRYPNNYTNVELVDFLAEGVEEVWVAKELELLGG